LYDGVEANLVWNWNADGTAVTVTYKCATCNEYVTVAVRSDNISSSESNGVTTKSATTTLKSADGDKTVSNDKTLTTQKIVSSISVETNIPSGKTIYSSATLDDIRQYLAVTAVYNDGTSELTNNFTLSGTKSGTTWTITVTEGTTSKTATTTITIVEVALDESAGVNATFQQTNTIYAGANVADLGNYGTITVTGTNNDGTTVTFTTSQYTLSLADGATTFATDTDKYFTVTITLADHTTVTTTISNVQVTAVKYVSLQATYTKGSSTVKVDTPINNLKDNLVVKAIKNDGTQSTLNAGDYTLLGTLAEGDGNTITVTYGNLSTTFTVNGVVAADETHTHVYKYSGFEWGTDGKSATVIFKCDTDNASDNGSIVFNADGTKNCIKVYREVQPTCTEDGYIIYIGTYDYNGVTYVDYSEEIAVAALGHNYTALVAATPADCSTGASGTVAHYECTRCDAYFAEADKTELSTIVVAAEHDYKVETIAATCTTEGYTVYTCKNCVKTYRDNVVPATGHTFTQDPTFYRYSSDYITATFKCDTCEKEFIVKATIETTDDEHNYIYTATAKDPNGVVEYKTTYTEPKESHTHNYKFAGWTWSEDGTTATATFNCTCTGEDAQKILNATVTLDSQLAPTCTTNGFKLYYATVTDETLIAAGATVSTYASTCKVNVEMTNHPNLKAVEAKAATCEEGGNVKYWYCPDCGKYFVEATASDTDTTTLAGTTVVVTSEENTKVDALGHVYSTENIVWTWSEDNKTVTATVTCTRCNKSVAVPATETTTESTDKVTYTATVNINGKTYTAEKTEETAAAKLASAKEQAIEEVKLYAAENNKDLDSEEVQEAIKKIENAQNADEITTNLDEAKQDVDAAEPAKATRSSGVTTGELIAVIGGGAMIIVCALLVIVLLSRRKKNL
jgi:hypothetical protein